MPKRKMGDRRDAVWLKDIPAMNRIMPCIMPNRADNEAFISFDLDYRPLEAYLEKKNADRTEDKFTFFHVISCAVGKAFVLRPRMNRFVCNNRLYQRKEITVAFTVKKRFNDKAEEALARRKDGEELDDLIAEYDLAATSGTTHATSDSIKETYGLSDGEISDVIENEYGYTIVKVVASEDQDYTDSVNSYYQNSATQEAVKNQEQEWFDAFPISDDDVETDVWNAFSLQEFL